MKENASVTVRIDGSVMTALIEGEIDHHGARGVRDGIDECFAESGARRLVLDMSRVKFMDSSGLGLILGGYAKAEARGASFAVADPSDSVRRVLDVAGAGRIVEIADTKEKTARGRGAAKRAK